MGEAGSVKKRFCAGSIHLHADTSRKPAGRSHKPAALRVVHECAWLDLGKETSRDSAGAAPGFASAILHGGWCAVRPDGHCSSTKTVMDQSWCAAANRWSCHFAALRVTIAGSFPFNEGQPK
jgi:hypothetical protein